MPRRLTTRPERRPPTFDLAKEACEAHFRETGLTPTTETIVERISVQNRPLIRRAIEDWLLDLPARLYRREGMPGIPQPVTEQFRGLWEAAVKTAGEAYAAERAESQAVLAARDAALAEAETIRAKLAADLEEAKAAQAESESIAAALRADLAEERRQREASLAALARTQTEMDRRQQEREAEQRQAAEKLSFMEDRLDKEHAWALRRIAEERETVEKSAQREIGRRDQEITQLKLDLARTEAGARSLREELATLRGRAEILEQSLRAAEAARDETAKSLTEALGALAELRGMDRLRQAEIEELRQKLEAAISANAEPTEAADSLPAHDETSPQAPPVSI